MAQKIIHIATDEKFINSAYWQFEQAFPQRNTFIILVNDLSKPLKYVELNDDFRVILNDSKSLKKWARNCNSASLVCFHGLYYTSSIIWNNISSSIIKIWFLFGFEFYNNKKIFRPDFFFGENTKEIGRLQDGIFGQIKGAFRNTYYKLFKETSEPDLEVLKAIKSAEYIAILYEEEVEIINKKLDVSLRQILFTYYPIENLFSNFNTESNILLGNSSSLSNNHLEIFSLLKDYYLGKTKLIVPLSYGDPIYRDMVIERGKEVFKESFKPLVDFMPLDNYNKIIFTCGVVIMNHYRQQAVGNVLTAVYSGAKIYLNSQSSLYHFLKRINVTIYSVEQIKVHIDSGKFPETLPLNLQIINREIILKNFGKEKLIRSLRNQLTDFVDGV